MRSASRRTWAKLLGVEPPERRWDGGRVGGVWGADSADEREGNVWTGFCGDDDGCDETGGVLFGEGGINSPVKLALWKVKERGNLPIPILSGR